MMKLLPYPFGTLLPCSLPLSLPNLYLKLGPKDKKRTKKKKRKMKFFFNGVCSLFLMEKKMMMGKKKKPFSSFLMIFPLKLIEPNITRINKNQMKLIKH